MHYNLLKIYHLGQNKARASKIICKMPLDKGTHMPYTDLNSLIVMAMTKRSTYIRMRREGMAAVNPCEGYVEAVSEPWTQQISVS